ncbi:hypothetical protein FH972_002368 [Carpinus fangiana]|uniref:Cytochrome P450 n=1 Tax=Carpinus fangiana TaxID=176857 RepID=A0A5N6QHA2_9ROSI|nr:hypothetical protein FH972_002368 [Carpinus fangiana]
MAKFSTSVRGDRGGMREERQRQQNDQPHDDGELTVMEFLRFLALFFLLLLPVLSILFLTQKASKPKRQPSPISLPRSYPVIGSFFAVLANSNRRLQWLSDIVQLSPSATYVLHRNFATLQVLTANPDIVQHILKTHFHNYSKGANFHQTFKDFLGQGIFNVDGEPWKFQRQVASHEFNTKSLRKFVEIFVDTELSDRLIPILSSAAGTGTVLDFQDILQSFAFDNVCKIAFGFDSAYLLPSLPQTNFAKAFEESVTISSERFNAAIPFPIVWKIKKLLNIGSEKRLRIAISEVREFAKNIIREKKHELREKASLDSVDLLSRFLSSGHSDENFVTDIVISFILAGRDTTSTALTCMRLYPPVASDSKEAVNDDVLPDGTVVKKGTRVTYIPYAMGRSETLWGPDWAEFKPERWLKREEGENRQWKFEGRDVYTYPVFQAGPRICLGKEMSFLQMKRVVAGVVRRFKVVPAMGEGVEPEFIQLITSKMKGGFPVRIIERDDVNR